MESWIGALVSLAKRRGRSSPGSPDVTIPLLQPIDCSIDGAAGAWLGFVSVPIHPPPVSKNAFSASGLKPEDRPLEREFRFHPERRWRSDFAHLPSRSLIEIEGGIWILGRHNRASGFNADLEKYLEASLDRWQVFRLGSERITFPVIVRLVAAVTRDLNQAKPVEVPGA